MAKYRVVGVVAGSKYLGEFEADTEDDARDLALNSEAASCSLCHQCSDQCEDPEIQECFVELIEE